MFVVYYKVLTIIKHPVWWADCSFRGVLLGFCVSNCVWSLKTSTARWPRPELGC